MKKSDLGTGDPLEQAPNVGPPPPQPALRPEHTAVVMHELRSRRRALGASSPLAFALTYLPVMFHKPHSRMHRELFAELATLHARRGSHLAVLFMPTVALIRSVAMSKMPRDPQRMVGLV